MKTMKAIRFKNRQVITEEAPLPEISENEALVKVSMAGICGTDTEIFEGYARFSGIAGHEMAGVVCRAPGQPGLEGKAVTADINCGCGVCPWCTAGDPRHCQNREVIGIRGRNGAFAEYCAVPAKNLHEIPQGLGTEQAVFAEPLAAALEITQQVHVVNTDKIAILGDGKMGLLSAMALVHASRRVTLIGRHARKLAIAESAGIATVQTAAEEPAQALRSRMGLFDLVVDATGAAEGIQTALCLVRPEGTVVVKTTSRNPSRIDLSTVVVDEIRILGSRCGDIALALRCLERGWVDVSALVEKIYPFYRFEQAFAHARQKGSLKILVDFEKKTGQGGY
ncbi:threonine dehydrogenase-like Zn-dependent dehydrogenase [Desulfosalsimonas propionicica]|uniref:Threonine dehydrogenase-like Zn-dependent dehydrogenase n=1 Tax=Desulfosalsimonas propionicica TaxID=332175 RepID=A0A7W0C9J2_9BACT|nr:alcohol dehydrogenase catalytic domain-containing protein [Desulfosalsimonas propionicica]MBA2881670.1 threonine dehydrogenase-like Zn-dependent dehydrogenase [Desulfosalsimonas propionicica]